MDEAARINKGKTASSQNEKTFEETIDRLKCSEAQFRMLFEEAPDGVILVNAAGEILRANAQADRLFGYSRRELVGLTIERLIPARFAQHQALREAYMETPRTRSMGSGKDLYGLRKDGSEFPVDISLSPVKMPEGTTFLAIVHDITERHQAVQIHRQQTRQQAAVAELGLHALVEDDLQALMDKAVALAADTLGVEYTKVLECQPGSEKLLLRAGIGWKPGLVGRATVSAGEESQAGYTLLTDEPIIVADFETEDRFCAPALLTDHEVVSGISVSISGREQPWGVFGAHTSQPRKFTKDEIHFISALANTLASAIQRHHAVISLQDSEEKFRSLFESAREGIIISGADSAILAANPAAAQILGYDSPDELVGMSSTDLYWGEKQRKTMFKALMEKGYVADLELTLKKSDGTLVHALGSAVIRRDNDGNLLQTEGFFVDITERAQAEQALQDSKNRLDLILNSTNDGVVTFDLDYNITEVNEAMLRITGFERQDLIGHKCYQRLHGHGQPCPDVPCTIKTVLEKGQFAGEVHNHLKADGSLWVSDISAAPIKDERGKVIGVVEVNRDITERVQAEEKLQLQGAALEAIKNGVVITDRQGIIQWVNPAFTTLSGYSAEEALGKNPRIFKSGEHDQAFYKDLWDTVLSGQPWRGEITNRRKDGSTYIVGQVITPVHNALGEMTHFVTIQQDITERVRAEAEIRRQNEEMARLYRASDTLLSRTEPDLHELSQTIVETISRNFGTSNCSLLLIKEGSQELTRAAVTGPYSEEVSQGELTLVGPGIVPRAVRTRQIINIGNVTEEPGYIPNWKAARSELAIPLMIGGKVIGVIDVQSSESNAFNENDQRLIATFTERAALALENARQYAEIQNSLREMETIFTLSTQLRSARSVDEMLPTLLSEVEALLHADAGMVMLLDPGRETCITTLADGHLTSNIGRTFQINEVGCGQMLKTRQPYVTTGPQHLPDLHHADEIGPAAFIPLQSEDDLLGVMLVVRHRDPQARPFSPEEARLLTTIGEMAGNTLRRIGLYDEAMNRLKRVQALHNIDIAITASLDPQLTLSVLLDEVTAQLEVDAAAVLLLNPHTQILEHAYSRGFYTEAIKRPRLRLGEGYAGRAALERHMVSIADITDAEDFTRAALLREENFVAYYGAPMIAKGRVLGVLETFHRSPLSVDDEWSEFLNTLAGQAAIAIDNAQLFQNLEQSNVELLLAYDATIEGWSRAMELRDQETEGHTQRVTELTLRLAQAMGIGDAELVHIRRGALLHDMGKLGIPDNILLKPGKLSGEEWETMRRHPQYAYEMLYPVEYLRPALDIPYNHHEKWDGTGYPRGLKGDQIPLAARIFAIVDVWDALSSDRPYREAWPKKKVLAYLQEQAGKHFDPKVVEAFLEIYSSLSEV